MIYGETYNASIYPSKIWNPLKLIFSEPNVTLLNLISYFKNHLLGICKSSHHSFNIPMLSIPCHEPYSSLSFWLFGECPFLEKWQLANKFSDSKVGCDGNTLLPAKKELKNSLFFFLIKNVLPKNFATFSNVFKAKESPRVTFECRKRVSQPEFYRPGFTDKYDHVISWNKDFVSQVNWLRKKTSGFSTFRFLLISRNDLWIMKNCARAKVEIKLFWHTRHPMINESRDLVGDIPSP